MKHKFKKLLYSIPLLVFPLLLTSCIDNGTGSSGVDLVQLTKNPVVIIILAIVFLIIVFKMKK